MRFILSTLIILICLSGPCEVIHDSFEPSSPGLDWSPVRGVASIVLASAEPRLSGIPLPGTGEYIYKVASDGQSTDLHLSLAGPSGQDMTVEAWIFCEGNDTPRSSAGYQAIVARASNLGSLHMVRMAWDPDYSEPGDTGDGWVKLQAYDGTTWDYLGLEPGDYGATQSGYILNGTTWPSGWHRFRLKVEGNRVEAYVDDMDSPVAVGTLSIALRDGQPGFYVWCAGAYAGYYDDFSAEVVPAPPVDYDLLVLNGEVYPNGQSGPFVTDIGIRGDRITAMGDLEDFTARRIVNASGLMVTPGFIDTHTHADSGGLQSAYLRQGVTTMVAGNCGSSPSISTLSQYYDSLSGKLGTNYIGLIGHNTLRGAAGLSGATPTAQQMQNMKTLIRQGMEAGAFGLSTGLIYSSGYNSQTPELIELAKTVKEYEGLYASHIRDEEGGVLTALEEAIQIGRESGCRVQISHAKCGSSEAWGLSSDFLELVNGANREGRIVRFDQYPYTASQTTISVVFPLWAQQNWNDAITNHREELEEELRANIALRGGADHIYLISGTYRNRYLDEVAASLGKSPEDVLIDDIGLGGANAVYHTMIESDVRTLMASSHQMIGSDGPTSGHPRGSGTFPRFWGRYVRDLGMFSKQEGVYKTSQLAAEQFRLIEQGRGKLQPGFFADITVFDAASIIDNATWDAPSLAPDGIEYVIVNGQLAVDRGTVTGVLAGRVLRLTDSLSRFDAHWRMY